MSTHVLIPGAGGAAWYWDRVVPPRACAARIEPAGPVPLIQPRQADHVLERLEPAHDPLEFTPAVEGPAARNGRCNVLTNHETLST
jgi:hypothetical protein